MATAITTIDAGIVRLRTLAEDDLPRLDDALRDASVRGWLGDPAALALEARLAGADRSPALLVIDVGGDAVGGLLIDESSEGPRRHATLELFLAPRFQGRGIGTRVLRATARHLIDERGHHRLTATPPSEHAVAIRTLGRIGFRPVGVLRRYERTEAGELRDALLMELLADELKR